MSGEEVDRLQHRQPLEPDVNDASKSLFAEAYDVGAKVVSSTAQWIDENPGTATAIGLVVAAGIGYITRGRWMPMLSRLAPFSDDAACLVVVPEVGFNASKAGLTTFANVINPAIRPWKSALNYADVGLDTASTLIYRGAKAGTFNAENVLLVNGAQEANTLFRALSREGLLKQNIWERGAACAAAQLSEVPLPGATKFVFGGNSINLPANGRLIDLGGGQYQALTSEAAEQIYKGLFKL